VRGLTTPERGMPLPNNVVPFVPRPAPPVLRTGPAPEERAVYTVKEVAYLLTLSLGNTYELIRDGSIPAYRLGRRWVIPRTRFHAWLDSLTIEAEPEISATPPSIPGPRRGSHH
jgi:excisionase family DNA binding protein